MKTRTLFLFILTVSIIIPVTSFAEQSIKTEDNFHEGTVEWISRCFMIGSTITIRVTDYDMNKDPENIERFDVSMWSDRDDRIVDYTISETGKNTGVFEADVFFTITDSSPGKRLRTIEGNTVFVKYIDYTLPNTGKEIDVIATFVMSGLSVLEKNEDNRPLKIVYDHCAIELFEKNRKWFDELDIFYPPPLKQFKSGILYHEIQCRDGYFLIMKPDKVTPVCVFPSSVDKLFQRNFLVPLPFVSGNIK